MEQQQNLDDSLTFEEAMEKLAVVVSELEKGELSLDESLIAFEKGIRLLGVLTRRLNSFEERVEVLLQGFYSEAPDWLQIRESGGRTK
ncbi:exodeoxyribonuclease VII small subunit [Syntrophaceticus schinkii]|jgi:exodeoxyribonuclease VII small subunit|uniref:Exodeoxyribonuclease 7 small subunit n=1 Tax=Syntrophaceticus schinkii TaxID=499207 RepID=A0A0B7MPE6_9FIRM|nr:exodeoxyribonuclease VII small subunit [Syntrophaceticus schinkii]MDD2359040.1 exodeoxyribonuclease VII small subunit [Syntrophaceticus schinkii]MDD4261870.1 exodeoxyribonuclease VII small subunit [Syntrophaceticus schinkii]MDD4674293.1 exodeoxyribonuclease VII small subunit [Syntrophaceticus schinkii]CEO89876.1 Exodeoxyribonuclease 7 small subunit (modular protein) [Syntrophaceticus schinkii]